VSVTEFFAGVPVTDLAAALAWYERLFGGAPDFRPDADEAVWRIAGGWVYVVRDPARAGNALLTLLVDDLEAHVAGIAARGLRAETVDTAPGAVPRARIEDADGNRITFGQPGAAA
jgi:catechol 2,3-dioxygenase-like lactoylglutathione lyase family enzyme